MIFYNQTSNANFVAAANQRANIATAIPGALINQSNDVSVDQLAATAADLSNYWLASLHLSYDQQLEQQRNKLRRLLNGTT